MHAPTSPWRILRSVLMVSGELCCEEARALRLMWTPRYDACRAPRDEDGLSCVMRVHVPSLSSHCEAWALRPTSAKNHTTWIMPCCSCRDMAIVRRVVLSRLPKTRDVLLHHGFDRPSNAGRSRSARHGHFEEGFEATSSSSHVHLEPQCNRPQRSRAGISVLIGVVLRDDNADRLQDATTTYHLGRPWRLFPISMCSAQFSKQSISAYGQVCGCKVGSGVE